MTLAANAPPSVVAPRDGPRRVLFVDAEPDRLEEAQRSLSAVGGDWDARYLVGGSAALTALDDEPVDILVTALHMPEVDGTELLQAARRSHPETVRIVVAGKTDQQASLKLTGIAHHFLTRPYPPQQLLDVIDRAVVLRERLRSPALIELVSGMRTLPSMPALHSKVVSLVMSPNSSLAQIGDVIARDPGMSAEVLQLVNSAFFGLRRRITDPSQAVTLLGINTVIALVLGVHIFSQMQAPKGRHEEMDALYRHALVAASASREIAHAEGQNRDSVSDFYLAGMLHDAGRLVLATNYLDEYAATLESADPLLAEVERFGASHQDVGAYLLGLWGLPDPIVEAAAFHHHPAFAPGREFTPLAVIHAVSALMEAPEDERPHLDSAYLNEVGVGTHIDGWIGAVESAQHSR